MQVQTEGYEKVIADDTGAILLKTTFENLYNSYFDKLFEYGCRLHNDQHLIQDCIQDVFIKLWNKRHQLSNIKNIKSYLFIALKNTILNKAASSTHKLLQGGDTPFELSYIIEEQASKGEISAETLSGLYIALNNLTDRQKECIYLRYFEGLGYEEISDLLNISTKATYKLAARALECLKANIPESLFVLFFLLL
ncbi:MAG: RNA polymerase sigma factor [Terrimonas sp.]|nr:RNA polymerase sigma factor [Terrimonas sp.]